MNYEMVLLALFRTIIMRARSTREREREKEGERERERESRYATVEVGILFREYLLLDAREFEIWHLK